MRRVDFRNSRGLRLAGHCYGRWGGAQGVVLVHGLGSDKVSRGRFPRLAEALEAAGYQVLAFDCAGCGESDPALLTLEGQEDDLRCATRFFLEQCGVERVAWLGHSLGSWIALRAWTPEIVTLVLTGALTGAMDYDWAEYFSAGQMREWAETGRVTMGGVMVDGGMLEEIRRIDRERLLGPVSCPVLLLHGDGDEEERRLLANSKVGLQLLPPESRLRVIPGAPHGFGDHYHHVIESVRWWIGQWLPVVPRSGSEGCAETQ